MYVVIIKSLWPEPECMYTENGGGRDCGGKTERFGIRPLMIIHVIHEGEVFNIVLESHEMSFKPRKYEV